MRAFFPTPSPHLFVCLWLSVSAAEPIPHAHASESPHPGQLSRQPLIEVAAFGVTPVSGVAEDSRLRPKPGDILHRQEAPALEQGRQLEMETRGLFGESWLAP